MNDITEVPLKKSSFMTNLKIMLVMVLVVGSFTFGFLYREAMRISGNAYDSQEKGQNVKVSGKCKVQNGYTTLQNNQVKLTKSDKNVIEGVVVAIPEFVTCNRASITIESYPVMDLFFGKTEIKEAAETEDRKVVRDQIYDLEKSTVLASAICTSKDKTINLSNRLVSVLSVSETSNGSKEIKGILLANNATIFCKQDDFMARKIDENDTQQFLELERKNLHGPEKQSFLGSNLKITGLCVVSDIKTKKDSLINFLEKTVKVTGENSKNGVITKITASTLLKGKKTVTVTCDKEVSPGLVWEETEDHVTDSDVSNQDADAPVFEPLRVTGVCTLEDGKTFTLFEQVIKVTAQKIRLNETFQASGYLKKDDAVIKVNCDKAKDKEMIFDKVVKNSENQ